MYMHLPSNYEDNEVLQMLIEEEMDRLGISLVSVFNLGEKLGLHLEGMLGLFLGIFSHHQTANYFYKNDLKVVVDILLLEATNLPVESVNRAKYLAIMYQLLMNCTDYVYILHKQEEILVLTEALQDDPLLHPEARQASRRIVENCRGLLSLDPADL